MTRRATVALSLFTAVAVLLPLSADARVVRLDVTSRRPFEGGKSFGSAGTFEQLEGTVYFEVNPLDPLNDVIVNLDKARLNAKGVVEFSAPFVIVKPLDMSRGNRKILYGINNRGNNIEFAFQAFPPVPLVVARADAAAPSAGDGLILRLGYTYVDAGWAGDIETTANRLGANLPVAVEGGDRAVVAPIRIEYSGTGYTLPLKGNSQFRSYETADVDTRNSTLTVRDAVRGTKKPIAADRWAFGRCPTGQASLVASTSDICLFDGFQAGYLYELTYKATGPWVMGLGYAVTRDLASFLRYATKDDAGTPNPVGDGEAGTGIRRVYALGTSSTGMYLREFLYLGFNEDEAHRKVFDAVRISIPGTHRLFANVEFADPNVYSRQDRHSDFLSHSYPPLTYAVTTDPISGIRDGILKRPATDPLVLHVDSANEFWQMNASLNVHDGRGRPVPIPDNVRLYFISSHSHTGGSGVAAMPTAKGTCEHATNGAFSFTPVMRALLVAMDGWADRGEAPPASQYPGLRDSPLLTLEEAAARFPQIPGVRFPAAMNGLELLDFGRWFSAKGGWLSGSAPRRGPRYQTLLPAPDADGLDTGGIRAVDVAAPVGTNTGWNLMPDGPRAGDLCGLSGSFIPFAKTKAQRTASGDPRLSLEERYQDHDGFVRAVDAAAQKLVKDRFLLEDDARVIVDTARASDVLRKPRPSRHRRRRT
jgi:hypothetical protein